jgi:hypothetical protein
MRRLRLEQLESRLALSATGISAASEGDCGCGGFDPTVESDVPLAVATALRAESFNTTGLALANFSGELTVYALDFKDGSYRTDYYLKDASGSTQLLFPTAIAEDLRTGNQVEVVGYRVGWELIVETYTTTAVSALEDDEVAAAITNRDTIVVPINFQNGNLECTSNELQDLIFDAPDSVAALYEEQSFGKLSFQGTVLQPVTIPHDGGATATCDIVAYATDAQNAATAAYGTNFDNYDNIIYALPTADCGITGIAIIGGRDSFNIGACHRRDTFAHELGHNLGREHSNTPDTEGGDHSSVMGLHDKMVHFNAFEKFVSGWIPSERITNANAEGTYSLKAIETLSGTEPMALRRFKNDTGGFYYISYRNPVGFDSMLDAEFANKVQIHFAEAGSLPTVLLSNLSDGELYSDEINNYYVKLISHTADTATVSISFTPPLEESADFDLDGDVDGRDFLKWQRGDSPNPLSSADLALWQEQYGGSGGEISDLGIMISDVESTGSLRASLAASRAREIIEDTAGQAESGTLKSDSYVEQVDRVLEQFATLPSGVRSFGEMVARRSVGDSDAELEGEELALTAFED